MKLFQILLEETFHLVVWNHTGLVVVEVNVRGTRDNHQFLVTLRCGNTLHMLACHLFESILREVAAMCSLSMYEEHGILNLVSPCQQRLIEERLTADYVPAIV